jgi:hypothetical protein
MGKWKNSKSEFVSKTIMAYKPNQLQGKTYQPKDNAIIERVHKIIDDMLK